MPGFALTRAEILEFAERWDPQPYHTDPEAAEASVFGGLVASGMHTLLALVRAEHDAVLGHTAAAAGVGIDRLRFLAPVRPGERLEGEIQVLDATPRTDRQWGLVTFGIALREAGGRDVLTLENQVLVWRRPVTQPSPARARRAPAPRWHPASRGRPPRRTAP